MCMYLWTFQLIRSCTWYNLTSLRGFYIYIYIFSSQGILIRVAKRILGRCDFWCPLNTSWFRGGGNHVYPVEEAGFQGLYTRVRSVLLRDFDKHKCSLSPDYPLDPCMSSHFWVTLCTWETRWIKSSRRFTWNTLWCLTSSNKCLYDYMMHDSPLDI